MVGYIKGNHMWKCQKCEETARYKGLCRSCTIYDEEDGMVITPIHRVRLNSDGTEWQPPNKRGPMATKDMLKTMRISRQKKPTKKQVALLKEELEELKKAEAELPQEEEFVELGTSVEEE